MFSGSGSVRNFFSFDFTTSIRDFEFTKKAVYDIHQMMELVASPESENSEILDYLLQDIQLIPFGEHLKRYLYREVGMTLPYADIPISEYADLLLTSFRENHAPFSFDNSSASPRKIVTRWLTQQSVKRSVIMLLGFGLRMKAEDVSVFLKKALLDADFDFYIPEEVIYWYCFDRQLPYARALSLLSAYEAMDDTPDVSSALPDWSKTITRLEYRINPEKCLLKYLHALKKSRADLSKNPSYREFLSLYQDVCEHIAAVHMLQSIRYSSHMDASQITPADVERELYAGIPRTSNGNLKKTSLSLLAAHLNYHILSRQRLEKLLNQKYPVRRFDLITLCFYLHGDHSINAVSPRQRFASFAADCSSHLKNCRMHELYPVNPYEAFVMICLLSDRPLVTDSDVLELSFSEES